MPNWLEAEYRKCGNCGKRFEVFRSSMWAYKQNNVYFCTWRCLREHEKKGNKKGSDSVPRKLTLEQKKKAVQIAIDGGNPLDYLKECGSDTPEKLWWSIKNKLKETHPELYEQIPDRRKKRTLNTAEIQKRIDAKNKAREEAKAVEETKEVPATIDGHDWIPAGQVEHKKVEPVKEETPFLPVKTEVKINLNDRVKVKLTVLGIKTYIDYMNSPNEGRTLNPVIKPKNCVPAIDEDGYTTFQLWQLFNIYGEHMTLGCEPMFLPLDIIKVG